MRISEYTLSEIKESNLEGAFLALTEEDFFLKLSDAEKEEITLLSSRFRRVIKREKTGLISSENANIERNKIEKALLSVVKSIDVEYDFRENISFNKERKSQLKSRKILLSIGATLFVAIVILVVFEIFRVDQKDGVKYDINSLEERIETFQFNYDTAEENMNLIFKSDKLGVRKEITVNEDETVKYLKEAIVNHFDLNTIGESEMEPGYYWYLVADHHEVENELVTLKDAGIKNGDEISIGIGRKELVEVDTTFTSDNIDEIPPDWRLPAIEGMERVPVIGDDQAEKAPKIPCTEIIRKINSLKFELKSNDEILSRLDSTDASQEEEFYRVRERRNELKKGIEGIEKLRAVYNCKE